MRATVVDLRYRMREILEALDRNEEVSVLYHGKVKGVLSPRRRGTLKQVSDHPFFGMRRRGPSVARIMQGLRSGRHRAV